MTSHKHRPRVAQRGFTLLELLIGLTLGLLVIAAAIGTLAVTRGATGTVKDVSQLQSQAAYALRIIGLQLRQTGSLEPVPVAVTPGSPYSFADFPAAQIQVNGTDGAAGAPDSLSLGNQPSSVPTMQRDCLGVLRPATSPLATLNPSVFTVDVTKNELKCIGYTAGDNQPITGNVADFQVNYRLNTGSNTVPMFQRFSPSQMTSADHWKRVVAIEVCLDMQGTEVTPDAGITYLNCQGLATARGNRIHLVYKNVFDLRKKNAVENPL